MNRSAQEAGFQPEVDFFRKQLVGNGDELVADVSVSGKPIAELLEGADVIPDGGSGDAKIAGKFLPG